MGNCLKINNSDDISLLRGNDATNNEHEFNTESNGTPPPALFTELIQPVLYPSPSFVNRPTAASASSVSHLTEEQQIKLAKRIGLIQHLPIGQYDGSSTKKRIRECVICMIEFSVGESIRYLPCMHIYHVHCIDDWLMRSLTCPSCMEPVDAALLTSYETT